MCQRHGRLLTLTMRGEAALYSDNDPNCASHTAEMRLQLRSWGGRGVARTDHDSSISEGTPLDDARPYRAETMRASQFFNFACTLIGRRSCFACCKPASTSLGSSKTRSVGVRILAATNADLRAAVAAGHFREDLFFRLNTVEIHLPPLRERRQDIPELAAHFLRQFAARYNRSVGSIGADAPTSSCVLPSVA